MPNLKRKETELEKRRRLELDVRRSTNETMYQFGRLDGKIEELERILKQ